MSEQNSDKDYILLGEGVVDIDRGYIDLVVNERIIDDNKATLGFALPYIDNGATIYFNDMTDNWLQTYEGLDLNSISSTEGLKTSELGTNLYGINNPYSILYLPNRNPVVYKTFAVGFESTLVRIKLTGDSLRGLVVNYTDSFTAKDLASWVDFNVIATWDLNKGIKDRANSERSVRVKEYVEDYLKDDDNKYELLSSLSASVVTKYDHIKQD